MENTAGGPIINEIHYNNAGGDSGEFIEVFVPSGTVLDEYSIYLYNGIQWDDLWLGHVFGNGHDCNGFLCCN